MDATGDGYSFTTTIVEDLPDMRVGGLSNSPPGPWMRRASGAELAKGVLLLFHQQGATKVMVLQAIN